MTKFSRFFTAIAVVLALMAPPFGASAQSGDGVVNIYSARKQELIVPLLRDFEEQTGIEFNLVTGKADELLKRLELEADATPADIFITVDAGRLHRAREAGVLRPIDDELVTGAVPAHLQDKDGYWIGLSKRARVIVYSANRVDADKLSTYEALADPQWHGRICIRSSSNIYNQSLVASMIVESGSAAAEEWARGLVGNLARSPAGGDTDQIRAVAAGECDLAVVNTYYFGRLAGSSNPDDVQTVQKLKIHWPNQEGRGAHVNVSGVPGVPLSPVLMSWGESPRTACQEPGQRIEAAPVPGVSGGAELDRLCRSRGKYTVTSAPIEGRTAAQQLSSRPTG